MTKTTNWLIAALLVGSAAAGVSSLSARGRGDSERTTLPKKLTRTASEHPELVSRVDDPKSQAYDDWLFKLKEARLREDEVLDLLDSDLSMAQKNALLEAHLHELSEKGVFPAPDRWSQRLSQAVFRTELDLDLGQKAGRILAHVSSQQNLAELEAEYRRRGATMKAGNKLAIVTASRNPEFVASVLADSAEPIEVRESAVERVADLGHTHLLEKIVAPDSKAEPTLKVASVGALAGNAHDTQELTKAVDSARGSPEHDAFGRTALNVAQVRGSESDVDGKSLVLFAEWKTTLEQLRVSQPAEGLLLQALVTGKAFSRALWTEANPQTAAQVIDQSLVPVILAVFAASGSPGYTATLQALAEFATDFLGECSMRAPAACAIADDRRTTYAAELASLIRPKLADTELAFYAQRLGS